MVNLRYIYGTFTVHLILAGFNQILIFSADFRKTPEYQISYESVQYELPCFMRTDAQSDGRMDRQTDQQTDMKKLTVAFRNFAKEGGIKIHKTNRSTGGIF
jgi:hypothetical protein